MGVDAPASELADRVVDIAARVFELDAQGLSMGDSPQTIERWDSLNHLKLITAIESEFSIRLRMQTVLKINDIAALVAAVQSHREE
jgi:acyl carrier protein